MVGLVRFFSTFGAALDEIRDARIFGGIHFRSACEDGQALGIQLGNYVLAIRCSRFTETARPES